MELIKDKDYLTWITELKKKVRSSQIKAAIAVNKELILFYWDLGKMLSEKIKSSNWGDKVLKNVSTELKNEFPEMKGFSVTNLKYCKLFFEYFAIGQQAVDQLQTSHYQGYVKSQQAVDQNLIDPIISVIPWGHIIVIITKIKNFKEAIFYIEKTKENNWSRDTLALQIKSQLFQRNGAAITNFSNTLPEPFSDLAQQTLKDPYVFDFMQLTEGFKEKDLENQLVNHIQKFLLELGKGFAFVGQQYHLEIANKDYYMDLLFYHIKLKCYLVTGRKQTIFRN